MSSCLCFCTSCFLLPSYFCFLLRYLLRLASYFRTAFCFVLLSAWIWSVGAVDASVIALFCLYPHTETKRG
jgi:hypothetical protein